MQAVGMIAEFNPLHNGHVHALATARRLSGADAMVVVMAGNFVQRGDIAVVDKWTRTAMALHAGADLVVELPVTATLQAADQFALGGVTLLQALGVKQLAFGTEEPDVDYAGLAQAIAAHAAAPDAFTDYTQTYATQLNAQFKQATGRDLTAPNLMLGLSYARANLTLGAGMTLLPFTRVGAGHDAQGTDSAALSASAIRAALAAGDPITAAVPPSTVAALAANPQMSWQDLYPWLRYRLLTATLPQLREVVGMSEGLEYRLTQQIAASHDFPDFLHRIKSKRYTYARLRRLCLAVVVNLTQAAVTQAAAEPSLHVLGFTAAGQAFLHERKKALSLPLITKVAAPMLAPGGILAAQQPGDALVTTLTRQEQNFGRVPIRV